MNDAKKPNDANGSESVKRPEGLLSGRDRRHLIDRIHDRFDNLYGEGGRDCLRRLKLLLATYEDALCTLPTNDRWTQADNVLITYADSLHREGEAPLRVLTDFLSRRLSDVVDTVHILPFFPWSSDDGFSVIDYKAVRVEYGTWEDVHGLGSHFRLMFDLVLNHCSRRSSWFRDYITGIAPQRYYFIEQEPGTDLSAVTRPRQSPLLHKVNTRSGERWVWTTFSEDQVDLNFANPDLLFEFIEIFFRYIMHGARIVRLDAIAYLWKQIGTACIHLPQTHEVVKLLRDLVDLAAPHVLLLTETNVPHAENVSYFGEGDEAHAVYNFSLPPLLLHAIRSGSARHLSKWAGTLGELPAGCTYLNFTASHDGIGVRPLEGLLPKTQIKKLADEIKELGGHVSSKSNPDGSTSPYEMNITYFDALGGEGMEMETHIKRFLCSQAVMLALRGIPAVYIHSFLATRNDYEGVKERGYPRAINRHRWEAGEIESLLDDGVTHHHRVFGAYKRMLGVRSDELAFHPDGAQRVMSCGEAVFGIERRSVDGKRVVAALANLSGEAVRVKLRPSECVLVGRRVVDLLAAKGAGGGVDRLDSIELGPYQVAWLAGAD